MLQRDPADGAGTSTATAAAAAEAELARVQVELATRAAHATPLGALAQTTRDLVRVEPLLREVLASVVELLETSMAVMWLYDPVAEELFPEVWIGLGDEHVSDLRLPLGEGVCGTALVQRQRVVMDDVRQSTALPAYLRTADAAGWQAAVSTPMITLAGGMMGTLTAYFSEPRRPTSRQLRLLDTYARQAGEMVERARMHAEAEALAALEQRRGAQLRQLADCALALSAAETLGELLGLLTESAVAIIDCHQGVGTRLPTGWGDATTHVVLSEQYAAWRDYDVVPKGVGVLEQVVRENRPLRLTGEQLRAHPEWRGLRDAPGHPPLPDYLAAPLIGRDGSNLGLVQLSHKDDGTAFTPEDESILVQLAQMASSAIERLEALDRERAARRDAEAEAAVRLVLSDASAAFSTSLEPDEVSRRLVEVVVPRLADLAAVSLVVEGSDELHLAALEHVDPALRELARRLVAARPSRLDAPYGSGFVVRTGEVQLLPEVPREALVALSGSPDELAQLRRVVLRSGLAVPLVARGRTLGALSLSRDEPYGEREVEYAVDLARRAALALDNASQFAFERQLASTLQRSLLPRTMPASASVSAASRYLAGARGTTIGGDWYDLLELDDGRLFLVVGDVMGRGVEAAAIMGQLRATVRAYALDGHGPAALLQRLDRVARTLDDLHFATCVVGLLDPVTGDLCLASAGHLPPLVIDPQGGGRLIELDPGLPLGVGGAHFEEQLVRLEPGSTVVLYTDGLVESASSPVDEGMARLVEAAREPVRSAEEVCERLLHATGRDEDTDDDTALLVVLLDPAGGGGGELPVLLDLPAAPESARVARLVLASLLDVPEADAVRDTALLLLTELVANTARHASGQVRLRAGLRSGVLLVEVLDESRRLPVLREDASPDDESGRGVLLVEALADRWGAEPMPVGKRVWFELALDRG